ncbi:hypothetical protein C4B63_282g26 [Trypanosoma cruzi]|uniref:AARP2CN domain-containing protein n=1 Tax=Trypanosoma cruzi TaxID=5693 RepID=A0A2V2UIH4_TRYCR|nr:hypothetical protein C4B63_282g26 [Trypanosoma cruzi]
MYPQWIRLFDTLWRNPRCSLLWWTTRCWQVNIDPLHGEVLQQPAMCRQCGDPSRCGGRSRRVTFIECPNTLTAMCDIAKVADLILLMVDGSFGFEMETFEFLNISQVHGFPRMFGVVSHLDQLKTGKTLKKRKKFLRHRFWHEVAAGAKLICLAPMVRGMYRSTDVLKLHRLLICVEPKLQSWRNTHSCVLIDRYEDITAPQNIVEDENCNRTIAFYGTHVESR